MSECFWQSPVGVETWCNGQPKLQLSTPLNQHNYVGVAANGSIVVALAEDVATTNSTDIQGAWTDHTIPNGGAGSPHNIVWTGQRFVAAGNWDGDSKTMYSTDGQNWTAGGDIPASNWWLDIAANNNAIVVTASGQVARSLNQGATWSVATVSGSWNEIAASDSHFVAINWGSSSVLIGDSSGAGWYAQAMGGSATKNWIDITWNGTVFMVVDTVGYYRIAYPADMSDWYTNEGSVGASVSQLVSLSDGTIVAIASDGSTMLSTDNGASWQAGPDFGLSSVNEYGVAAFGVSYYAIDLWNNTDPMAGAYSI